MAADGSNNDLWMICDMFQYVESLFTDKKCYLSAQIISKRPPYLDAIFYSKYAADITR